MFDTFGHIVTPEMVAVVSANYFEFPPHYVSSHFKTVIATVTAMKISTVFQLLCINLRYSETTKFHMQPRISNEYGENYMKLTAYVSRSSLLESVRTAVHVKRKWTFGSEGREDSVVFRCQQYHFIFTKVLGRVDYVLFVTKHPIWLREVRPPARTTDTPLFLRKTVALTW